MVKQLATEAGTPLLKQTPEVDTGKKHQIKTPKENQRIYRVDQFYSRIINAKGLPTGVIVDIRSPKLAAVLKQILQGAEGLDFSSADQSPEISPEALFFAWEDLKVHKEEELLKKQPDHQLVDDLSVALEYLEVDHGSTHSELKVLLTDNLINYRLLNRFFKPGDILYSEKNELNERQVLKLVSATYDEDERHGKHYAVNAKLILHDAEYLGWGETRFFLQEFEGNMKITDLDVFPFSHHPAKSSIEATLIERGRRFMDLIQKPVCKWYGAVAVRSEPVGFEMREVRFMASKRVMIDPQRFGVHNSSRDKLRKPGVRDRISPSSQFADGDIMCCSHRVLGFSFEEKKWGAFAVSKLQEITWNKTAFDKVVLPTKKLSLVRDLIISHRVQTNDKDSDHLDFPEQGDDDIIKGKGQGLVGLLSGNPGVGKTLTAEAVAELSHRPLYAISAGELGSEIEYMDRRLVEVLNITRSWNCVLLIDEADVFLHRRGTDLASNAVVSIFLRRLEYFQGVAILTTNRKVDIDPAFMSRIHFKLHYSDLGFNAVLQVWRTFLSKEIADAKSAISEDDLQHLAKEYKLSGREQIKNAAFCAKSISRTRNEPLSFELVRDLIDNLGYVGGGRIEKKILRSKGQYARTKAQKHREWRRTKVFAVKAKQSYRARKDSR
ncbi:hypothetical protein H9Q72_003480 [Fusarium xylarioides]|uniref:AAA+ ATPase domain-containing protein n=1 Tax=Fusarium xylarioides TaxID=221167 RepID=A0A9P7I6J2_9HYPO|nr:hypothetical protein H9Q72_003480 [Fusarium xylarioides]